jgi:hypothetical protein
VERAAASTQRLWHHLDRVRHHLDGVRQP